MYVQLVILNLGFNLDQEPLQQSIEPIYTQVSFIVSLANFRTYTRTCNTGSPPTLYHSLWGLTHTHTLIEVRTDLKAVCYTPA